MSPRPLSALACTSLVVLALVSCGRTGSDEGQGSQSSPNVRTAGLTPAATARPQASGKTATAEVVGVMVHAPTANSTGTFERLGFAGTFNRSRIAIQIYHPGGGLIDMMREESQIEWFGDDRGTDLVNPDEMWGPIEMLPEIAEDGCSLVFIIGSNRSPHSHASRLEARGTIIAVRATETANHVTEVAFRKGESFALGPFEFEITGVGDSEWSDDWTFELTSKKDLAPIIQYSLVTDGADEELQRSISMSGMGVWKQTLTHPQPLEQGTLRIECWSDASTVELPFSVSAGLSLH